MDQLFQNAMKFAKQYMKKHPTKGLSNVYVIRKTNAAGESTGEYYGMNQITEYGFTQFIENGETFPTNVYFGKVSLDIQDKTDVRAIVEPISSYPATVRDATIDYAYPLIYDSTSWNDMYYLTCKYVTVYIPANSQNFPSDPTSITEYGIGESVDALWTYSRIYDENGNKIIVDRLPDEELEITVYFVMGVAAYYMSSRSNTPIITTMHRFFERFHANVKTVKNDVTVPRVVTYDTGTYSGTGRFITSTLEDLLIPNSVGNANGYIDGMFDCSTGFLCADLSAQNQTIDKIVYPDINHIFDNDYVENMVASVPWSDVKDITIGNNTYQFNPQRKATDGTWSAFSTSLFLRMKSTFYNLMNPLDIGGLVPTLLKKEYAMPLYVTNGDTIETYYVYRNMGTINDIAQGLTVYVTDTFYRRSSWATLSGYNSGNRFKLNVASQKTKKFFITTTNSVDLLPSDYIFPSVYIRELPNGYDPASVANGVVCQYGPLVGTYVITEDYTIPNMSASLDDTFVYSMKSRESTVYDYIDQDIENAFLLIEKNSNRIRTVYKYSNQIVNTSLVYYGSAHSPIVYHTALFDSYITSAYFWNTFDQHGSKHNDPAVCIVDNLGNMDLLIRAGYYPEYADHIYDNSGTVISACVINGNVNNVHFDSNNNAVYEPSFETDPSLVEGTGYVYATSDEVDYYYGSIRLAIITSDAPRTLKIYQFNHELIEHTQASSLSAFTPYMTIEIGTSSTPTPKMVYAFNQIIAVSDASTYTWIAKVTDANHVTTQMVNTPIPFTTSDTSVRYSDFVVSGSYRTLVTNAFVLYKHDDPDMSHAYLVTASNVTNLGSIDAGTQNKGTHCKYTIAQYDRLAPTLVYSAEYQTATGVTNEVYDLAQFIYNGTVPTPTVEKSDPGKMYIVRLGQYYPPAGLSSGSLYGYDAAIDTRGKLYPISRFVPLNLHISTDAITAIDGNKLVSNRWVVQGGLTGSYPTGTPM